MSGGGEIDMDGGEIGTPRSSIALENADQTIVFCGGAIQVALANDATGVVVTPTATKFCSRWLQLGAASIPISAAIVTVPLTFTAPKDVEPSIRRHQR